MQAQPSSVAPGRFAHVDFIRAIAVLFVVFFHSGIDDNLMGTAGVTMFFVVSGFVITNLVLREAESAATAMPARGRFRIGRFYLRRAFKLLPPLLVAVVLPSVLVGIFTNWQHINGYKILAMLGFVFNAVKIDTGLEGIVPGTVVTWSLSVEEQFYLGFAALWFLLMRFVTMATARRVLRWLALVSVAYSLVASVVMVLTSNGALVPRVYFGTDTRMGAISLGVLVALAYRSPGFEQLRVEYHDAGKRASRLAIDSLLVVTLLLGLVALGNRDLFATHTIMPFAHAGFTAVVICYGLLVAGAPGSTIASTFSRITNLHIFQLIGRASYSIYLVHYPLIYGMRGWWHGFHTWWDALAGIVVGVSAGVALWLIVERPIERLKNRFVP